MEITDLVVNVRHLCFEESCELDVAAGSCRIPLATQDRAMEEVSEVEYLGTLLVGLIFQEHLVAEWLECNIAG